MAIDRRSFLALIPSLGALPFIGKEIVREKSKIIISEPQEIEVVHDLGELKMDKDKLQFLLVYDGKVIGSASRSSYGIGDGRIEYEALEIPMYRAPRAPRLNVEATFDEAKVAMNLYNAMIG